MIRLRHGLLRLLAVFLSAGLPAATGVSWPSVGQAAQGSSTPGAARATQSAIEAPGLTRRPDYQFPLGQTFVYGAQWRVFNAGVATLRVEQAGQENRVVGTASAIGSAALLYHVQDKFESFLDPATFCSRSTSRQVEEGFRRVNTNITFDYQRAKAVFDQRNLKKNESKHLEHDIGSCVTDMLSGIYYAASLPLQPGRNYTIPLNDGGATILVNLHVEAREQIKTPAGTFNTLRVQPEATTGLLKDKGKIWIWFSDDAAHIPVQMRGRMYWGTLTLMLQRIDHK